MTRQQPTNPDAKWVLTPLQHSAVDLLAVGTSGTDAAASVGVTRQTVSKWPTNMDDSPFRSTDVRFL